MAKWGGYLSWHLPPPGQLLASGCVGRLCLPEWLLGGGQRTHHWPLSHRAILELSLICTTNLYKWQVTLESKEFIGSRSDCRHWYASCSFTMTKELTMKTTNPIKTAVFICVLRQIMFDNLKTNYMSKFITGSQVVGGNPPCPYCSHYYSDPSVPSFWYRQASLICQSTNQAIFSCSWGKRQG